MHPQLVRSPEDDGLEADLEQTEQNDAHEEAEEEPGAATHARGLEDVTDAGERLDEQEHPCNLRDHAGCQICCRTRRSTRLAAATARSGLQREQRSSRTVVAVSPWLRVQRDRPGSR